MSDCPICGTSEQGTECSCGFGFIERKIVNREKLLSYFDKVRRNEPWPKWIALIKAVHDVGGQADGLWSQAETARILNRKCSLISDELKLAQALSDNPNLGGHSNKTRAVREMKSGATGVVTKTRIADRVNDESVLQDLLFSSWSKHEAFEGFDLLDNSYRKGKFNTNEVGEIDFLAQHRTKSEWLVVEIKTNESTDTAVGQLLRYMGWVKEHKAGEQGLVRGAIISAFTDNSLYYALKCVENVVAFEYELSETGEALLHEFDPIKTPFLKDRRQDVSGKVKGNSGGP